MAIYTIELRSILYSLCGLTNPDEILGEENIDKIIDASWSKFFDFDFPVWDGGKEEICKHILEDYYFREIGFNTMGRFKAAVKQRLRDIMPYYIEMYYTTQLSYNVLQPTDYVRTFEGNSNEAYKGSVESSGSVATQNFGRGYDDNSPATATTSSKNDNNSSTSNDNTNTTKTNNNEHVSGKMNSTSYASIIKEERENIINILQMISEEMGNLFMAIW